MRATVGLRLDNKSLINFHASFDLHPQPNYVPCTRGNPAKKRKFFRPLQKFGVNQYLALAKKISKKGSCEAGGVALFAPSCSALETIPE